MSRKYFQQRVSSGKYSISFGSATIAGCHTIEAIEPACKVPIGTVWYGWAGNATVYIYECYVIAAARRLGVLTSMITALLKAYPHIRKLITGSSTRYSKPWLKRSGFVEMESGDWVKIIKPDEPKKS